MKVHFTSNTFKWVLVAVLSIFTLLDVASLATKPDIFSVLHLSLKVVILFMVFRNHKWVRTLVKLWSALLVISSIFALLSFVYATEITGLALVSYLGALGVGIYVFARSEKYIELVLKPSSNPLESTL